MKKKILIRRMLRSPQFVIGFLIVLAVVIVSLFAKQLAPMDENLNHIEMCIRDSFRDYADSFPKSLVL